MDNTMKELQERMNKMEERLDSIYVHVLGEEEKPENKITYDDTPKPQNNGFFVPEVAETYWYNSSKMGVEDTVYLPNIFDDMAVMSGNCFRTKEQAEAFNREKHYERMEAWQLLNSYSDGWSEVEENYVISINSRGDIFVEHVGYDNGAPATFRTTEKAQAVLDHLGEETIRKAYGRV